MPFPLQAVLYDFHLQHSFLVSSFYLFALVHIISLPCIGILWCDIVFLMLSLVEPPLLRNLVLLFSHFLT